jgi:NADPH-dependent curcumin reductase CurA
MSLCRHDRASFAQPAETVDGFDQIVAAFAGLFRGQNTGKTIVQGAELSLP